MKKPEVDWTFLDKLNTTALNAWVAIWLWVGTFFVWAVVAVIAAVRASDPPVAWLALWTAGLGALSGIAKSQFTTMRDTDYKALEIKATAAKGAVP